MRSVPGPATTLSNVGATVGADAADWPDTSSSQLSGSKATLCTVPAPTATEKF